MIHSEQFLVRFEEADPYTRVQDVYGTYPALAFRVHLTRRLSYMLLQVYLPSGLFVVVSFVSLLVPADAIPGRMTLCITTILTMQSTPRVSYVRAIDVWLLSCLSFVSIVLLEFGAVIKLLEMEKSGRISTSPSRVVKISLQTPSAQDTTAAHHQQQNHQKDQQNAKNSNWILGESFTMSLPSSKKVDRVSLVLLPSCFFVFNLAYWGWFLLGSQAAIPSLKGSNSTVEAS
ncbi:Glutamate-gated chloride channel alpha [Portunus trituberculatus]|uniref:Glutamate-gated chloride channel alpha n=1 Tax=Portunus trituberculatus TaxID=210409 RepID=A0A5B7CY73_PORTR|nr:Glutamate-gated chloride channel alpha [Portunus trituberculatus]